MSDAEMIIRLIGDSTPEEQSAISQPMPETADSRDTRRSDGRDPAGPDADSRSSTGTSAPADPRRRLDLPVAMPQPETDETPSVAQVIENIRAAFRDAAAGQQGNSFEVSVAKFGQYVETLLSSAPRTQPEQTPAESEDKTGPRKNTWLSRMESRSPLLRTVANRFRQGRRYGAMLAKRARKWAATPGRGRIGKAARSVVSRVLGPTAQTSAKASGTAVANAATGGATAGGGVGSAGAAAGTSTAAIGMTVGATVAALAAVGIAAGALVKAFNDAADDIERLSPDVALARARSRMTTELNMLDRAQRIGPASGRLEAAKGALGNQVEKLLTDILSAIAKFEPQITAGVNFAEAGVISIRGVIAAIDRIMGEIQSYQALLTPADPKDDAAAAARIKAAENDLAARFNELTQKLAQAAQNLAGVAQPPQQGIDPILLQILQGGP